MSVPNNPRVPWLPRGTRYTEDDIELIVGVLRDANTLTEGPYRQQFEDSFASYSGAANAFAVTSCTSALHLSAALAGVGPGDDVVLPAHTFAATAIPFAKRGARLVWADIDPETLVVTADTIAAAMTPATKAIVVVHLYGLMAEMDPILELAKDRGVPVVEDSAQALGATDRGRHAGSLGDFGTFSFHSHKNLTTLGEGGMLTVRDPALAALVPGLRHNGVRGYEGERERYWLPAMSNVDFDVDGMWPENFPLGEVQCAAGLAQLGRIEEMNGRRRAHAATIMEALAGYEELTFQKTPDTHVNAYYCLPARYDLDGRSRDDFMERMIRHHGVQMAIQYYPLYRYPMFQKAGFGEAECPETDRFFDHMVSFPFHEWMPDDQFDYMVEAARETLDHLRG